MVVIDRFHCIISHRHITGIYHALTQINNLSLMMTSSNGNIFRVTGPWLGKSTGYRWIPLTKASHRRGSLMFYLICTWTNSWTNNRHAGHLRHHRAHYNYLTSTGSGNDLTPNRGQIISVLMLTQFTGLYGHQGAVSIRKTVLPGMAIPMLKIRRPNGRLIFNMEITIRR